MVNVIQSKVLFNTDRGLVYTILEGPTTAQPVEYPAYFRRWGNRVKVESVTPYYFALLGPEIFNKPQSEIFWLNDGLALKFEDNIWMQSAVNLYPTEVVHHTPGESLSVEMPSRRIASFHRTLQLVKALPQLQGKGLEDAMEAEKIVRAYDMANEGPNDWKSYGDQLALDFDPDKPKVMPHETDSYKKKIKEDELRKLLEGTPIDTFEKPVDIAGLTRIVLIAPHVSQERATEIAQRVAQ